MTVADDGVLTNHDRRLGVPMSLNDQLTSDLKAAMVAGDTRRRDVIRFLRAAIANARIEKRSDLNDDEIQDIIRHQIKQRRDSIELFRRGGRDELADEEEAQIAVLQPYLPQQLGIDDLRAIVRDEAEKLGAVSSRDMGRLMPAIIARADGRAEGRLLSQLAREELERRASETGSSS